MKVFYSDDCVSTAHSIDATKKPKWVADSLRHMPIPNVDVIAPSPATFIDLQRVHSLEYIRAVQTGEPRELAESSTFFWDGLHFVAPRSKRTMCLKVHSLDRNISITPCHTQNN